MAIIQVLDYSFQCEVGEVDVHLALTLEIFFIQQLHELMLEDVFFVRHFFLWSTWAACCWIHLGNCYSDSFVSTGSACGGRVSNSKSCPVTVRYVYRCISRHMVPFIPLYSYDWMVDALA